MTKTLSTEIREAAEEMSMMELYDYLDELDSNGEIEINRDGWDFCRDFALHLIREMESALDRGEWWGYELRALNALEELSCDEDDLIKINAYGFPEEIEDNDDLLDLLGVIDQLKEI